MDIRTPTDPGSGTFTGVADILTAPTGSRPNHVCRSSNVLWLAYVPAACPTGAASAVRGRASAFRYVSTAGLAAVKRSLAVIASAAEGPVEGGCEDGPMPHPGSARSSRQISGVNDERRTGACIGAPPRRLQSLLPQLLGVAGRAARDAAGGADLGIAQPRQRRRVQGGRGGGLPGRVSHVVDARRVEPKRLPGVVARGVDARAQAQP